MSPATLDRAGIARRIPHQGSMCLLDGVQAWDGDEIRCRASSHRDGGNPLRSHGRLGIACGIEYAAQAMAVHGTLLAGADEPPRAGYLVAVRDVALHAERLDDVVADLEVSARRLLGDGNSIVYGFSVDADRRCLLSGRATVMLDAAPAAA